MNIFKTMAVKDRRGGDAGDPGDRLRAGLPGRARRARRRRRAGPARQRAGRLLLPGRPRRAAGGHRRRLRGLARVPRDAARRQAGGCKINENNIGYLPVNESMQRASTVHKATRPNYNESFFISHDRGADHPDVVAGTAAARPQPVAGGPRADARRHAALLQDARGRGRADAARAGPRARHAGGRTSRRSSPTRRTSTCASSTIRRRRPTTTSSSARARTPTTRSSRCSRARTCPGLAVRLPSGEWLAPPVIRGHLPRQPRQHDEAVVERPLPLDARTACSTTRARDRYSIAFFYSPNVDARHRVPAELHRPRQSAALRAGGLPRPRPRRSTTRTTSTGPDTTKPRRPDPARRQPRYSRVVPAITASTSPRPMVIAWPAWPATMVSIDSLTPES